MSQCNIMQKKSYTPFILTCGRKITFRMSACRGKHAEVLILIFVKLYPILIGSIMRSFSAAAMN